MKKIGIGRVVLLLLIASIIFIAALAVYVNFIREDDGKDDGAWTTVKFETYTDTKIDNQVIANGSKAKEPTVKLEREGYTFVGWYNEGKKWDFNTTIISTELTLTAKWERYFSVKEAEDGTGTLWLAGVNPGIENAQIPSTYNGKSITGICSQALAGRTELKSIKLPSTLAYISADAFDGCTSLESIVIPKNVSVIEEGAFVNCPELKYIYCEAESLPNGWSGEFNKTGAQVIFGYNGAQMQ